MKKQNSKMISYNNHNKPKNDEPDFPEDLEGLIRPPNVTTMYNKIYFYDDVEKESVLDLNKALYGIGTELINYANQFSLSSPGEIHLHINSWGDDLFAGFMGANYIKTCKVPVTSIIDGICASAATFMSISAKKRLINRNSFMLVHQLTSGIFGKYSELQEKMIHCDKFMTVIKNLYKEHTKIATKQLDDFLKKDSLLSADECLKLGLVDEIV